MKQDQGKGPPLRAIVSDLRSGCMERDSAQVSAALAQLFACLKKLDREALDSDRPDQAPAASWLLIKCAENLRELEWQMTSKWDEVRRTADLAEKCAVHMGEPVRA